MNQVKGPFADVLVVRELRGDFPDVAFFADVNIEELTRGDSDPVYLTIPIGKINVKSDNGRFYSEAWVQELERQVRAKRPTGMMGHEEDDPMAFPPEAIFWVGAQRIGEMLWGKGYLPPGPPRDRIRRYKATNKTLGTSILALAEGTWDAARGAYTMLAETLDLRRIDIGPIEKLGIKALGLVPILTSELAPAGADIDEMHPGTEQPSQEAMMAEKKELIQELRGARVPAQRGWQPSHAAEVAELSEIRELLGLDENGDVVKTVKEMRQAQETQRQAAVKARIVELATPDPKRAAEQEKGIAQEAVRALVIEMVQSYKPATVEEVDATYDKVVGSAAVTELLKSKVVQTMGPRQGTPVAGQNGGKRYFVIPSEEEEG